MHLLLNTTSPYARLARIALAEKGYADATIDVVDPWGDTPRLLEFNAAARVPTLVDDGGVPLTESLLIVMWLEHQRPSPSLLGAAPTRVIARAGVAMGVIDAAVHTLIGRKITDASFDTAPVGLRRRRTMGRGHGAARSRSAAARERHADTRRDRRGRCARLPRLPLRASRVAARTAEPACTRRTAQ